MGASPMALLKVLALRVAHGRPPCWRSRRRMAWDARRPQRKSARGISPSVRRERNSRRGAEPSGRARSCIARRAARDATGRTGIDGKAPILKSKARPKR